MKDIQRKKKLWRIPFIVAVLVGLFWGVQNFFGGQVPAIDQFRMIKGWTIQFPFPIYRWSDVIFAPLLTFVLILIFSSRRYEKDKEEFAEKDRDNKYSGGAVLAGGSWSSHLGLTFIFAILLGIFTSGERILISLGICLLFCLLVSLSYSPISSLYSGLALTLFFSLFAGFGLGLVLSLVVILQYLFIKRESWISIGRWLIAK